MIERLLDTSTASNWMRRQLHELVDPYLQPRGSAAISFQTQAELLLWITSPTLPGSYRRQIQDFLATTEVFHSSDDISAFFAEILRRRRDAGRPENVRDAWIAATALAHGFPLITFDQRGFNDIPDLDLVLLQDN